MASNSRPVRLPADLADIASLRAASLGYENYSEYVRGLIRYDAMVCGPHDVTLPISRSSLAEQDKVDAKLLEITKRGKGERGQLLKRLLERAKGDVSKVGQSVKAE